MCSRITGSMNQLKNISSLTRTCLPKMVKNAVYLNSIRNTNQGGAYEGDGKTTVNILNNHVTNELITVDTYSNSGFRINSGIFFLGPIAIFPRTVFQWDVNSFHDISEESLSLFWLVEPKVDILVLGIGDRGLEIDPKVRLFLTKMGITCEALPTSEAIATFNFLNNDNRNVAGALIPPTQVGLDNEDRFLIQQRKQTLFEDSKEGDRAMQHNYALMSKEIDDTRRHLQERAAERARRQKEAEDMK